MKTIPTRKAKSLLRELGDIMYERERLFDNDERGSHPLRMSAKRENFLRSFDLENWMKEKFKTTKK